MILDRLKNETAHNHKLLESNSLLSNLMTNELTVEVYTKILSKFYTYFLPIENIISPFFKDKQHIPDFPQRRKASFLEDDLHNYNVSVDTLDLCQNLPEIKNVSQALGALYVMEGSTLGGRFISKKVNETINATPTSGAKFYFGYGKDTGVYWKNFCAYLSCYANVQGNPSDILQTANSTFLKLNSWLDQ